jgi:ParB-like chromosome segregation protein Spo0J
MGAHDARPIVIDADGRLTDGHNRLAACELAGVEPTYSQLNGDDDPEALIWSANGKRRHMSSSHPQLESPLVVQR